LVTPLEALKLSLQTGYLLTDGDTDIEVETKFDVENIKQTHSSEKKRVLLATTSRTRTSTVTVGAGRLDTASGRRNRCWSFARFRGFDSTALDTASIVVTTKITQTQDNWVAVIGIVTII